LVRRSDGLHIAVARQRKDASPWQGEAGAQRRVRVGCVVDRRSTHSLTFHPLPRPSQGEGEESTWLGATDDGLHIAVARQRKDASPWQGEAGAQRRVRVGCVVDRRSTHSLTFHPLPRPSQGEGEESTWLGATE
jgi:hypothetical protein